MVPDNRSRGSFQVPPSTQLLDFTALEADWLAGGPTGPPAADLLGSAEAEGDRSKFPESLLLTAGDRSKYPETADDVLQNLDEDALVDKVVSEGGSYYCSISALMDSLLGQFTASMEQMLDPVPMEEEHVQWQADMQDVCNPPCTFEKAVSEAFGLHGRRLMSYLDINVAASRARINGSKTSQSLIFLAKEADKHVQRLMELLEQNQLMLMRNQSQHERAV
ncbi:MAG: hypothetical protein GY924_11470, partial [Planctomycetaceae bacterium]|nr:hypothetical protein [Planctomycetaceae bacterium]